MRRRRFAPVSYTRSDYCVFCIANEDKIPEALNPACHQLWGQGLPLPNRGQFPMPEITGHPHLSSASAQEAPMALMCLFSSPFASPALGTIREANRRSLEPLKAETPKTTLYLGLGHAPLPLQVVSLGQSHFRLPERPRNPLPSRRQANLQAGTLQTVLHSASGFTCYGAVYSSCDAC
jgi:hypothetical protein